MQDVSKSATHPIQGPGTSDVATQPLQAPGAGTTTQPSQAPSAGPEVLPTGYDAMQLDQSLPGVRTCIFLNVKCIFLNKNVYTYHMKTLG